jgi:hypothetical protein
MKWAYRRKDYFVPRSMKEAYGYDETYEPEIRCCSELFYERMKTPHFWGVRRLASFLGLLIQGCHKCSISERRCTW